MANTLNVVDSGDNKSDAENIETKVRIKLYVYHGVISVFSDLYKIK
jgi:hypothetical protein